MREGGEYKMDRTTPVWADEYGACDYNAIAGVQVEDGVLVIRTMNVGDYR